MGFSRLEILIGLWQLGGQGYGSHDLEQSPQTLVHPFATHSWDLHFSSAMNVVVVPVGTVVSGASLI